MAQTKGSAATGLRPNKRYIATHDKDGNSIYASSPDQVFNAVPKFGGLARSYSVASVPADLTDDVDVKAYLSKSGPTSYTGRNIVNTEPGPNLMVVDLEPGAFSAMHQTVSIDFSICVIGEIDHELDGGEKVRLLPGDHIVQRGTMHRWSNPSKTQAARFVAVSLPCKPFEIKGEMLREVHIASEKWDREREKAKAKL